MIGPDIPAHILASSTANDATPGQEETNTHGHGDSTSAIGPAIPAHVLAGSARPTTPEGEPDTTGDATPPSSIGPVIPPEVTRMATTPPHTQEESDEEEECYAPALPPDMLAARASAPGGKTEGRRVVGPTLPPHLARRNVGYEDEDDDDYGPAPLPSGAVVQEKSGLEEFIEKEERRKKQLEVGHDALTILSSFQWLGESVPRLSRGLCIMHLCNLHDVRVSSG